MAVVAGDAFRDSRPAVQRASGETSWDAFLFLEEAATDHRVGNLKSGIDEE
jgi:hypothetical protein